MHPQWCMITNSESEAQVFCCFCRSALFLHASAAIDFPYFRLTHARSSSLRAISSLEGLLANEFIWHKGNWISGPTQIAMASATRCWKIIVAPLLFLVVISSVPFWHEAIRTDVVFRLFPVPERDADGNL